MRNEPAYTRTIICISDTATGIDLSFVDIKVTALFLNDVENQQTNLIFYCCKTNRDWSSDKIESTLKEISLWATICAIH